MAKIDKRLTTRVEEYRLLMESGFDNDQIARRMSVSREAVKRYIREHPELANVKVKPKRERVTHDTLAYRCTNLQSGLEFREGRATVSLPREPWVQQ